jgi:hypothetical protein
MAAEWQTESEKHWNFRLPAKICKWSLASSANIYSDKEVFPKAMNRLLLLGTPFGVFIRVENAIHKLTYASQHISLWQIKLVSK